MATEIAHRPQEPQSNAIEVTKDVAPPLPPNTGRKPIPSIANGEASDTAAPTLETTNLPRLFGDTTSDASASDAGAGADSESTSSRVISPITSPPYWQLNVNDGSASRPYSSHNRTVSAESVLPAGAIQLQDNEDVSSEAGNGDVSGRDRNRACWARSVEVASHVVVNGSATNIGAFVVWNIRVETLTVSGRYCSRGST